MAKVVVGMSGGVDSSVAAHLLKEQGYEVEGVSFVLYEARNSSETSLCCSLEARDSAAATAAALGVSHRAIDLRAAFIDAVVDPFVEDYRSGRTPNPCILCNRHIKFPWLLKAAEEAGADFIATGHYARVSGGTRAGQEVPEVVLRQAADRRKDQSYVLYVLEQKLLDRLLLPLGEMTKDDVRQIARSLGLPAAERPESQEICFVEDNDYAAFIGRLAPETIRPGPILDADGRVLGQHKGISFYTVGQRKGLNVASLQPHFVTRIDPGNNSIRVGLRGDALRQVIRVKDLNWFVLPASSRFRAAVKIRSMMEPKDAVIELAGDLLQITFDEPQWAPAPGQSAVIYDGDLVLGGGIICSENAEP